MGLLAQIEKGARIDEPVALVVAHPDDEVIGLGSRLACFDDLTIIHLTDGAPRDLADATARGFADWRSYADARECELQAALDVLGAARRRIGYRVPDQETSGELGRIVARLAADLDGMAAVITHPYEHGHPDHDSAALAVARAAPGLPRYEFASYHLTEEGPRFGAFWPDPDRPETAIRLSPREKALKQRAVACFATQRDTLAQFDLGAERIRRAPDYDFARPAPPGTALYECWGFVEDAASWRRQAAAVLEPAWA